MKLAKFKWRRLAAAVAIGLGIEVFTIFGTLILPREWQEVVGNKIILQPSMSLVWLFAKIRPPGFEEQFTYVLLELFLQWIFYSAVVYLLLAKRASLLPH